MTFSSMIVIIMNHKLMLSLLGLFLVGCASEPKPEFVDGVEQDEHEHRSAEVSYHRFQQAYQRYEEQQGRWFGDGPTRLHYLDWGQAGMPLIWLHGTYSSAYEFAPFAEDLATKGYRVLALDYYGHGKTALPLGEVSIQDAADLIAKLMDELGIEKAVLGGWSRGGSICAAFHDGFPDRVLGLALVDGGSWSLQRFTDSLTESQIRDWLAGGCDPVTGEFQIPSFDSKFDFFLSQWQARPTTERESHAAQLDYMAAFSRGEKGENGEWLALRRSLFAWLKQLHLKDGIDGMIHSSRAPLFLRSTSVLIPEVAFRHLSVPVLIIDPTGDFMDMTQQNRKLAAMYPDLVELRLYEDTGHSVLAQRPERFASDLDDLLKRIEMLGPGD